MADVFVSYSRRDVDFVRVLTDGLKAQSRDVWVDIEGIPPSAEWMAEVRAAIESSGVFLFVISPDSLASRVCGEELEHAVSLGKRIVPVVYRDAVHTVPGTPVSFAEGRDLDAAARSLAAAIDAGAAWVETHTRLTVRGLEWESKGKSKALLFRGGDLDAAESALAEQAGGAPSATPLQAEFLLASRSAATRRQRGLVSAITAALVLTLLLSVLAVSSAGKARAKTRDAQALQLASAGQIALQTDQGLAALLAAEGLKLGTTDQATRTLRRALSQSRQLHVFRGHRGAVNAVDYDRTGHRLVSGGGDGLVLLWNADTGKIERTIKPGDGEVFSARFDPSGSRIVAAHMTAFSIWDAQSGKLIRTIHAPQKDQDGVPYPFFDVKFGGEGHWVIASSADGTAGIWSADSGERLAVYEGAKQPINAAVIVGPNKRVVTAGRDKRVNNFPITSRRYETTASSEEAAEITDVEASASGGSYAYGSADGKLTTLRYDGLRIDEIGGHEGPVRSVAWSADGTRLVSAGADGSVRVWGALHGVPQLDLRGHAGEVEQAVFRPDGRAVASAGDDGTIRIWEASRGTPVEIRFRKNGYLYTSAVSADGKLVAAGGEGGIVVVIDSATHKELFRRKLTGGQVGSVGITPDGKTLLASVTGSIVAMWELPGGREITRFPGNTASVCASADSSLLGITWRDGATRIYERATRKQLRVLDGKGDFAACAFSDVGSNVLTGGPGNSILVWDARTGKSVATLTGLSGEPRFPIFSSDGKRVVASDENGSVIEWDVASGKQITSLALGSEALAAFSPDGRLIVACGFAVPVRVLDATTGERLVTPPSLDGAYTSCAFTPNGHGIVASANLVAAETGSLLLYQCDECGTLAQLMKLVPSRAGRALTAAERRRYLDA